jgi:hypothetical protein
MPQGAGVAEPTRKVMAALDIKINFSYFNYLDCRYGCDPVDFIGFDPERLFIHE